MAKKKNRKKGGSKGGANGGGSDQPPKEVAAPPQQPPVAPGEAAPAGLMIGVMVALAVATAAAGYLLNAFMLNTYGAEAFESACNFSATFNCDKLNTSEWGKIGGIPITIFAIPTYLAMGLLAWLAKAGGPRARGSLALLMAGCSSASLALITLSDFARGCLADPPPP